MGTNSHSNKKQLNIFTSKTIRVTNLEEFFNFSFSNTFLSLIFTINLTKDYPIIKSFFDNLKERIKKYNNFKLQHFYLHITHDEQNNQINKNSSNLYFLEFLKEVFEIYDLIQNRNIALNFSLNKSLPNISFKKDLKLLDNKTYLFLEFNRFQNSNYFFFLKQNFRLFSDSKNLSNNNSFYDDLIDKVDINEKYIETYLILYGNFWNKESHFNDLKIFSKIIIGYLINLQKKNFCFVMILSYKETNVKQYLINIINELIALNKFHKQLYDKLFLFKFILCDKSRKNLLDVKIIIEFKSKFFHEFFSFLYIVHTNSKLKLLKNKVIINNVYDYLKGFLTYKKIENKIELKKELWFNKKGKLVNNLTHSVYTI